MQNVWKGGLAVGLLVAMAWGALAQEKSAHTRTRDVIYGRKFGLALTIPVDRASSAVQAVGAFCPPTDFLNWSKPGDELIDRQLRPPFTAAQDYHEFNPKKAMYEQVKDREKLREIARKVSPIYHVKQGSAPALILHGDKDDLVPFCQAESILEKYREAKVAAKLVVRKGAGHVWATFVKDMDLIVDWFDEHLRKAEKRD